MDSIEDEPPIQASVGGGCSSFPFDGAEREKKTFALERRGSEFGLTMGTICYKGWMEINHKKKNEF